MCYMYIMEYYSAIKRNRIGSFVGMWMAQRVSYRMKSEKQVLYINAYMWNLEKWYRRTGLQGRNGDTDVENKCMDTKRGIRREAGGGGMNWQIGIDMYTLMCIKLMTNKEKKLLIT